MMESGIACNCDSCQALQPVRAKAYLAGKESAESEVKRLTEERDENNAIIKARNETIYDLQSREAVLEEIARSLVNIKDASDSGKALFACQGQAMDGFSELAHYRDCADKARAALAETKEEKG